MENEQAKKNFLIKVGVIASVLLILIFWFLNSKNVFVFTAPEPDTPNSSLDNLLQEFTEAMNKMEGDLGEIKENENIKRLADEEFLRNLMAETEKLTASSSRQSVPEEVLESSATSSSEGLEEIIIPEKPASNGACPAYVNCMPTIGEARQCSAPPGCEGITQFVY